MANHTNHMCYKFAMTPPSVDLTYVWYDTYSPARDSRSTYISLFLVLRLEAPLQLSAVVFWFAIRKQDGKSSLLSTAVEL